MNQLHTDIQQQLQLATDIMINHLLVVLITKVVCRWRSFDKSCLPRVLSLSVATTEYKSEANYFLSK